MEKKTSNEWFYDLRIFENYVIFDPHGWNKKNFHYSFYVEEITREEFEERLFNSILKKATP